MFYNNFKDEKISAFGMGCMRLPKTDASDDGSVNVVESEEMVAYAYENGCNYFDTAWGYHNGKSETIIGQALSKYPRESFYLADKFPGYDPGNWGKVQEIFAEQLKKCQVDYFDFYLFHNVCEMNIDAYLDDAKYGIYTHLTKMREEGAIKHLGFSVHGSYDVMKRFLDAYGAHMEFCQIQLNYIDWKFQDAENKVKLLDEYRIPVWVMEPLRGGKLAALSEEHEAELKTLRPDEGIPAWAFRFLQTIPSVTMILSGMSNFEQMKDNIRTFETDRPLNEAEMDTLLRIADKMANGVPCTACHYCTDHCPQGIDIPTIIKMYNEHVFTGGGFLAPMLIASLPEEKRPAACLACQSCEAVCPQGIKISEIMADFAKKLQA